MPKMEINASLTTGQWGRRGTPNVPVAPQCSLDLRFGVCFTQVCASNLSVSWGRTLTTLTAVRLWGAASWPFWVENEEFVEGHFRYSLKS